MFASYLLFEMKMIKISEIIKRIDPDLSKSELASLRTRIRDYLITKHLKFKRRGKKGIIYVDKDEALKLVEVFRRNLKEKEGNRGNKYTLLKKEVERLVKENKELKHNNKKLNDKVVGFADSFKEMAERQQELTARSQQLQLESNRGKERIKKLEERGFWARLFNRES